LVHPPSLPHTTQPPRNSAVQKYKKIGRKNQFSSQHAFVLTLSPLQPLSWFIVLFISCSQSSLLWTNYNKTKLERERDKYKDRDRERFIQIQQPSMCVCDQRCPLSVPTQLVFLAIFQLVSLPTFTQGCQYTFGDSTYDLSPLTKTGSPGYYEYDSSFIEVSWGRKDTPFRIT